MGAAGLDRHIVRWTNSPRERCRKRYGNLVREMEWALLELRALFPQKQYEEIVVGTCEALFDGAGGGLGMEFEPHLPETSCTIRMWWKPQRA